MAIDYAPCYNLLKYEKKAAYTNSVFPEIGVDVLGYKYKDITD